MPEILEIDVTGMDKLLANLTKFAEEINTNISAAGKEAGNLIIKTEGLQKYPPATSANTPPTPYYIRGRGTQYASKNNMKSERYGTQFYIKSTPYVTVVGNRASYAKYLAGEQQARAMQRIGWRKLIDVANEKAPEITKIFQAWIDRTIKRLGL